MRKAILSAFVAIAFGFHGYGPHQMLSALESGLARSIADCDTRHVIYLALVEHVQRSAGLPSGILKALATYWRRTESREMAHCLKTTDSLSRLSSCWENRVFT